ncbi:MULTISPECIES: trans-aconitate 2-methyltransferase [unclassified Crossiella]|uniref:class I SAM-dependent methyltransferase n=1 Tax=unclassified Crossiella TaxID=2620835 RepID=UPI001FFEA596|nr:MULTISPECIES: class I SAM-dependent methyltransferase [unclassified Crossiella]MCK2240195.1 class I SAM-dependent methyltransferase [Crossiella sp. S99.2]MCK2253353.1 class I SAM-dependent methyltransferase [Crossiella sp. S99.1]
MTDIDWAAMADLLEREAETNFPYVEQALAELSHLTPRRILDIGSGPGVAACQLAAAFPQAEVTAVDGSPELLDRAELRAKRLGVTLRTQVAEFPAGLADLDHADLVWSGQVVHHVGDQQDALHRLTALLNPGGVLAIVEGGLPTRCLPRDLGFGRPGLATRLDAATTDRFNRMRADLPGTVPVVEDWKTLLANTGLTEVRSKTFLIDHPSPLSEPHRQSIRRTLERQRHGFAEDLAPDDLATLDRLLDPKDPAGVDQRQDLFFLSAKTVHYGTKP